MKDINTTVEIAGYTRQAKLYIKKAINVKNKRGNIPDTLLDRLTLIYQEIDSILQEIQQFKNTG